MPTIGLPELAPFRVRRGNLLRPNCARSRLSDQSFLAFAERVQSAEVCCKGLGEVSEATRGGGTVIDALEKVRPVRNGTATLRASQSTNDWIC